MDCNVIEESDWRSLYPQFLDEGKVEQEKEKHLKKLQEEKNINLVKDDAVFFKSKNGDILYVQFIFRLDSVRKIHKAYGHCGPEIHGTFLRREEIGLE